MVIQSVEELRALYQKVSGRAKDKVFPALDKHSKNFIHHSPFLVLSTVGSNGKLDASPRGGEAGFVKILSDNELLIADSKGNNRLDSLSNIVETGEIGMLLMIPGVDETLHKWNSNHLHQAGVAQSIFRRTESTPDMHCCENRAGIPSLCESIHAFQTLE